MRLILGNNPQTYIAVKDDHQAKGWYWRIRDQLTHVSVQTSNEDGVKRDISLNIGSLCKRTQLSVATIFLMWLMGRLTLDYIEQNARKAIQNYQIFDKIIENGRLRAVQMGKDPEEKAKELREVLETSLKSRRLAKGILLERGESCYIAHQDEQNRFSLIERADLLGEGVYGWVFEVLNLGTGEAQALKLAKKADKKGGIPTKTPCLIQSIEMVMSKEFKRHLIS